MENPATWGAAENTIDKALKQAERDRRLGIIGWSLPKQIAEALREAGLLREQVKNR